MAFNNIQEDLFKSIDTIVQSRIANLPYDKTIECEVIDISNSKNNIYKVSYQNISFEAISTIDSLQNGDIVYVQIPQNDFRKDKIIVALKQNADIQNIKVLPFLKFIKGNNLFSSIINQTEYTLLLNSNKQIEKHFTFVKFDGQDIAYGYTRLGVKATFNSAINTSLVSGDYGLKITIHGYDQRQWSKSRTELLQMSIQQADSDAFYKDFYLRKEDMVGTNLYNTKGFQNQEKIFDITGWVIDSIVVTLWQDNNFKDAHGESIENKYVTITNLQLYLGYDISQIRPEGEPTLIIQTADGLLYDNPEVVNQELTKTINFKIIQRIKNTNNFIDSSSSWLVHETNEENTKTPILERYDTSSELTTEYSAQKRFKITNNYTWNESEIDNNLVRLNGANVILNPSGKFFDPIQNGFCYSIAHTMDQNFINQVQKARNQLNGINSEEDSEDQQLDKTIQAIIQILKDEGIEITEQTYTDIKTILSNKTLKSYYVSNELWFVHKDHSTLLDKLMTAGVEQILEDEFIISGSLIYSGPELLFKANDGTVLIRLNTEESQFIGNAATATDYKQNGNIYNNFKKIEQVLNTLAPGAYTVE